MVKPTKPWPAIPVTLQRIGSCDHGWVAEEVVPLDEALVSVYEHAHDREPAFTIRCLTWEHAREWIDTFLEPGRTTHLRCGDPTQVWTEPLRKTIHWVPRKDWKAVARGSFERDDRAQL